MVRGWKSVVVHIRKNLDCVKDLLEIRLFITLQIRLQMEMTDILLERATHFIRWQKLD